MSSLSAVAGELVNNICGIFCQQKMSSLARVSKKNSMSFERNLFIEIHELTNYPYDTLVWGERIKSVATRVVTDRQTDRYTHTNQVP